MLNISASLCIFVCSKYVMDIQLNSFIKSNLDRKQRLERRNRIMIARLYYWHELMRIRFDDVLTILSENEFFIEERTISNAWKEQAEFYEALRHNHTTPRQLQKMFPNWKW